MSQVNNFEEYGRDYQLQLFNEIITDHKFGSVIIDLLEPEYFKAEVFGRMAKLIKNYYEKHEVLLDWTTLIVEVNLNLVSSDTTVKTQLLDTITEIRKCDTKNLNVQEKSLLFCRYRKLKETLTKIQTKVDRNHVEDFTEIETELKKCFEYKLSDDPIGVFENVDNVLDDESREPIPTGIEGIDKILHGGVARGEVALVIAPLGVGKTSMLTKVANTGYETGRNVLQVFFEDKSPSVQRKHYTAMTGIPLNELSDRREDVKKKLLKFKALRDAAGNHLHLVKLPADGTTVSKLKNLIKRINSKYPTIDLVVIDYVDCLTPEKGDAGGKEEWSGEGKIMRQVEVMAEEMNVALWTATQGSRSSTSVEVVRVENMGGNLKKAQIAHFIMSIGKTLEQKEQKVATISILKNRMGDDGMIFSNCKFDNGRMLIDTGDIMSEKGFEDDKKKNTDAMAKAAYLSFKEQNK